MRAAIPTSRRHAAGATAAFAVGLGAAVLATAPAADASSALSRLALGPGVGQVASLGAPSLLRAAAGPEVLTVSSTPASELPGEAQRLNTLIPVSAGALQSAAPFRLAARSAAERSQAVRCLATAIYYEAALESEQGQRAVAQVVLNRVRDPNFPKSVCGVVYQGWERTTGCQFSFTCDGALLRGALPDLYRNAERYARDALEGRVVEAVGTATHYHADYVVPYWAPSLSKIGQVGAHIFYRWPGTPGTAGAFTGRYRGGELAFSEAVLTGRAPRSTDMMDETGLQRVVTVGSIVGVEGLDGERIRGVITPAGRRRATPEQIEAINGRLRAFEAEQAAPSSIAPAADDAGVPAVTTVDVVEINKPAPAGD